MFTLDQVVPFGRSFDEYRRMFDLSGDDLLRPIVGCGDGPAAFNAEVTRRGGRVVSCDPIYRFSAADIEARIDACVPQVLEQTRRNAHLFLWGNGNAASVEALGDARMGSMRIFLDDFETGRAEGRYVDAELPALPLPDGAFAIALCSHFLFLYSAHFDVAFHVAALREMARLAPEARVFPLMTLNGERSPYIEPCAEALRADGLTVTVDPVPYEFHRGGNEMLRVRR